MLTELLEHEGTWNRVMPGARACVFAREPAEVPLVLPPLHFEALFCRAGSLVLTRRDGTRLAAGSREVLLLTDIAGVTAAKMESALSGVLVAVEARAGRESLKTLCDLLGNLSLDTRQVRQWMDRRGGCAVMGRTDWIGAVFDRLEQLPREEWGRYCVLKSVELLYLLCMQETEVLSPREMDQSRIRTLSEARGYIEEHLEEPLTIEALSRPGAGGDPPVYGGAPRRAPYYLGSEPPGLPLRHRVQGGISPPLWTAGPHLASAAAHGAGGAAAAVDPAHRPGHCPGCGVQQRQSVFRGLSPAVRPDAGAVPKKCLNRQNRGRSGGTRRARPAIIIQYARGGDAL